MSSSLFRSGNPQPPQRPENDLIAAVNEVKRQIGNQDPAAVLRQLCQQDPQIQGFVNQFRSMNPMQLAAQFFKK